jgi:hypothetical protein
MTPQAPKSSGLRNIVILAVLAAAGYGGYYYYQNGKTVTIGTKDQVIYSGLSTQAQATALGNALKTDGYFQDSGFSVLLRKAIGGSTIISYVVQDGVWNDPTKVSVLETVTRDVASTVGGLPIDMRLVNSTDTVEKDEMVTAQSGTQPGAQPGTQPGTQPPTGPSSTVTIGTKDEVIYSGTATQAQATALGNALKTDGYFQDRGVTVLLDMGAGGTTISFVVQDGVWNQPGELFKFDEVAREVAGSVGGLPLKVQLMDSKEDVEKTSSIGEVKLTGGDSVIYEGEATQAEAQALGQQLQTIRYLTGKGSDVFVGRHNGTTILSFVVADGAWNAPSAVSGFETVTRTVAPTIGGLPIRMRMVSTMLVVEKDETVNAQGVTPVPTRPAQT